ncbi:hypothetical protein GOP47_0006864 [Adiantum capillus-veneris]|uniref:Uncharacterized protein n=1 Tax=Adiantum capillus-veneris TaxID=13818 RepID=A0A9D4ZKN7_ADICA|nr:hypothetical protein GOP47_0006864 [Adiantum capillus-veneris]
MGYRVARALCCDYHSLISLSAYVTVMLTSRFTRVVAIVATFEEVSAMKTKMENEQTLPGRLQRAVEEAHQVHTRKKLGRARIEGDGSELLLKASDIKVQVRDLDASKASGASGRMAECGPRLPFVHTCTSITHALCKKLKHLFEESHYAHFLVLRYTQVFVLACLSSFIKKGMRTQQWVLPQSRPVHSSSADSWQLHQCEATLHAPATVIIPLAQSFLIFRHSIWPWLGLSMFGSWIWLICRTVKLANHSSWRSFYVFLSTSHLTIVHLQ